MKYYFLESFNFIIVPKKYRNENEINFSKLKNLIFVPRNENEIFVNRKTERNENRYDHEISLILLESVNKTFSQFFNILLLARLDKFVAHTS